MSITFSIARILNDSDLPILIQKFYDLKMDLDGVLYSHLIQEFSLVNQFEIKTIEKYGEYDVYLHFYHIDSQTKRIIYHIDFFPIFIGTKHKKDDEKIDLLTNLAELKDELLKKYPKALALRAFYKIQSIGNIASEEQQKLIEINPYFRLNDNTIFIKIVDMDQISSDVLEKIKQIFNIKNISIACVNYEWIITLIKNDEPIE